MVEIFKTNISKRRESRVLIRKLLAHYPESDVHMDLQDRDRILRVKGDNICADKIIELVTDNGYECEPLI